LQLSSGAVSDHGLRRPGSTKNAGLYSALSDSGFRRSGEHLYVPACKDCRACIPVRVPVAGFRARRGQRRVRDQNAALRVVARQPVFDEAHFQLYRRYLNARHRGGGMDDPTPEEYLAFLTSTWCPTVFYEFRDGNEPVAVAVTDRLEDGLSAVYTFFDPTRPRDGLGTYAILWQIEEARRQALSYLYLGYLIEPHRKMRYKADYQPQERLIDGQWVEVSSRP